MTPSDIEGDPGIIVMDPFGTIGQDCQIHIITTMYDCYKKIFYSERLNPNYVLI